MPMELALAYCYVATQHLNHYAPIMNYNIIALIKVSLSYQQFPKDYYRIYHKKNNE